MITKPTEFVTPTQNKLLAQLPRHVQRKLFPLLDLVNLSPGTCLHKSGENILYVYFPINSIISLYYQTEDGASAEVSVVGNEGLVGIPVLTGGESSLSQSLVVCSGYAFRLARPYIVNEFKRHEQLTDVLLLYMQVFITQMAQTVICNRRHTIDQQLCRWLLLSLDRLPSDLIDMTQDLIANMLGVRREGITESALKLKKMGAIEYHRGRIRVLDRPLLEKYSCECYNVVKNEYLRLFPTPEKIKDRRSAARRCHKGNLSFSD